MTTEGSQEDAAVNILGLSLFELGELLQSWGEPDFRAKQIYQWIYQELTFDFRQMSNLPKALREKLATRATIQTLTPIQEWKTPDGLTTKTLFRLPDNNTVEAVLLLYPARERERTRPAITVESKDGMARRTVCVSTQVGCGIGCPFCATGRDGLIRNLRANEIVGQVLHFAQRLAVTYGRESRVTNLVLMGQGEPLANFEATWRAIETLNSPYGFNLGARHVTISTAGIPPRIKELSTRPLQVGLAVSLHAPNDALRNELVPLNKKYPIATLLEACREYIFRTHRRITFEYAPIAGVNDGPREARQLAALLSGFLCHVNLIPLNPTPGSRYQPSPPHRVLAFKTELERQGIATTVRAERGSHIEAACGQLRARRGSWDGQARPVSPPPPGYRATLRPSRRDDRQGH
ncbi:MAG: 23S rRNA (adenine(2503)-C(2))-methyltransferase RlmN [Chloroflexi bacterium]|nr:23S rRNA (adenine(2503)-C(2))-methyltransferase RlmN [Chloroflexota bacterium]